MIINFIFYVPDNEKLMRILSTKWKKSVKKKYWIMQDITWVFKGTISILDNRYAISDIVWLRKERRIKKKGINYGPSREWRILT